MLQLDLEGPESDLIGTIDRVLARSGQPPIAEIARGVLDGLLGRAFSGQQQAARQHTPPQPRQAPPPPPGWAPPSWVPPHWVPPWANAQRPRAPGSPPHASQQRSQPPAPDPILAARAILGFEPTEPLTVELVKKRKTALAQVFHPDRQGGSETQMKKINAAADVLLATL